MYISDHGLVSIGLAVKVEKSVTTSEGSLMPMKFKWHDGADFVLRNVLRAVVRVLAERTIENACTHEALNMIKDLITTAADSTCLLKDGR